MPILIDIDDDSPATTLNTASHPHASQADDYASGTTIQLENYVLSDGPGVFAPVERSIESISEVVARDPPFRLRYHQVPYHVVRNCLKALYPLIPYNNDGGHTGSWAATS
ncbi:hypothetical protein BDZ89DRAFT_1066848 [Hymenopellis radicata]|nr:hypothetical protein BDZ89DRAFT_1066848 [Hymenopellis radicata]